MFPFVSKSDVWLFAVVVVGILFNSIHSLCINLFIYIIYYSNLIQTLSTIDSQSRTWLPHHNFCFVSDKEQKCVCIYNFYIFTAHNIREQKAREHTEHNFNLKYSFYMELDGSCVYIYICVVCVYNIQENQKCVPKKDRDKKKRANVMNWTYRVKIARRHPTYKCLCYLRFRQSGKPNNKSSSILSIYL